MKLKPWILLVLSSICLAAIGVIDLVRKNYTIGIIFIVLACFYVYLSVRQYKRKDKPKGRLLSEAELEEINKELIPLIEEGKKMEAIKKYRMITGTGLKEAHDYVELLSAKKSN